MNTVKVTIFQCEGPAEHVAAVLRGAAPMFGFTLLEGEVVRGELLTVEPSPAPAGEAEREAPAKPSARPSAKPLRHTKARAVPLAEKLASIETSEAPAPRTKTGDGESLVDKVVAAFGKDNNHSIPKLAERLYGDSSGKSVNRLKQLIHYAVARGKLKRIGAGAYSVVSD